MEWPLVNNETGKPSTTPTNQAILRAAVQPAKEEHPELVGSFEKRLDNCRNWRSEYRWIFEDFARIQARSSPSTVMQMCQSGLDSASNLFKFKPSQSESAISVAAAFANSNTVDLLKTVSHSGLNPPEAGTKFELGSPLGSDAEPLSVTGKDAVAQLQAWQAYGCMEPSAKDHAQATCEMDDVSTLVSDKTFVLLGVTSEMGPALPLLKLPGAHVMGTARSGGKMQKLVDHLRRFGSTNTTLLVPDGGTDLLKDGPQIAKWIVETAPSDRRIVLMPLAYMDGESNVRVTVAMDQIVEYVRKHRSDTILAYLTSPATAYAVPQEAVLEAAERASSESLWIRALSTLSLGNLAQTTNCWEKDNSELAIFNGIVNLQGPNYALAKTMQQWRCMVANAEGTKVAAPHAPGTRTYSVIHSSEAAAGLEGWQYIEPFVAFDVHPCSTLMAAILLSQVSSKELATLNHPMELFFDGSVHGGVWRCPYKPDSLGPLAYVLGKTIAKQGWCPADALAPNPSQQCDSPAKIK